MIPKINFFDDVLGVPISFFKSQICVKLEFYNFVSKKFVKLK